VAEKLKMITRNDNVPQDLIEEFEDENGNVYNKRTYEGNEFLSRLEATRDYLELIKWNSAIYSLLVSLLRSICGILDSLCKGAFFGS
jgi:spermidine/putrescine-binding protein